MAALVGVMFTVVIGTSSGRRSSRVSDQSELEAINSLAVRDQKLGKRLHLRQDCRRLLDRAGDLVEANISEDPHYHVMTDRPK